MIASGYDNAICIAEINEQDIKEIEKYTKIHSKSLIEQSNIYNKSVETFAFVPGHRKLLLSLPKRVKEFEDSKSRKKKQNHVNTVNTVSDGENQEAIEEIELLTSEELDELKKKLLGILNRSVESYQIKQKFTENSVSPIETYINNSRHLNKKPSYKCNVNCVACEKNIPCTWNGHWQVSNLNSHLKLHKNSSNEQAETEKELNAVLELKS